MATIIDGKPTVFNGAYRFTMEDVFRCGVDGIVLEVLKQVEMSMRTTIARHEAGIPFMNGELGPTESSRVLLDSIADNRLLTKQIVCE